CGAGGLFVQVGRGAGGAFAAPVPFSTPYLELRRLGSTARSLEETRRFSADVYAYFTADPNLRLWGPIAQAWPHAEGVLFPGLTIAALAAIGAVRESRLRIRSAAMLPGLAWAAMVVALLLNYSIRLPGLKMTSLSRVLMAGALAAATLAAVSGRTRATVAAWLKTPAAFFTLTAVFAIAMSFGPDVRAKGRMVADVNIYAVFYNYIPGFDGLRVPARAAMIAALALAALAGLGIAALDVRYRRRAAIVAGALIVVEAAAVPIPIDENPT